MEKYKTAKIFVRTARNGHTVEYSWNSAPSTRIHGAFSRFKYVALQRTREAIDAEIAEKDICNKFFRMALR